MLFVRLKMMLVLMTSLLVACTEPIPVPVHNGDIYIITDEEDDEDEEEGGSISSLPIMVPAVDAAEAELGWLLFWDPILSGDKKVACATCHLPEFGYSDGLPTSIGVGGVGRGDQRVGGIEGRVLRNAPTLINAVFNGIDQTGQYDPEVAPMFWDNRATGFADQALGPVRSALEMRGPLLSEEQIWEEITARINAVPGYRTRFESVYGGEATAGLITQAIAAFESTLVANNSRFDQWMRGDTEALNAQEKIGMVAFLDEGCADCHNGPMFSNYELHVLAAPDAPWAPEPDKGDGNFAFRTPTLRQLEFTGPYFHAGHTATIEDAVEFYDNYDDDEEDEDEDDDDNDNELNPAVDLTLLDEKLQGVDEDEIQDIAAFLRSLSDPGYFKDEPAQVPSGLPVGGFQ
jgi:cytochrome c peroxidase